MTILITGATGFIGGFLVERLARTDHDVRCLVRPSSDTGKLKEFNVTLVTGDVTDRASLRTALQGCDQLINLANVYSFWEPNPCIYAEVNVEGTRNVMECALESGISKVVHISTMLVYGKPADEPFTEQSVAGPIRFSAYAQTKFEGDLIAWSLHEKKKLPLVALYPSGVLGPGDPKGSGQYIIDLIERRIPTALFPDATVTWVHVRDVAEAIVRAMEMEGNIGTRYLVGKHHVSMREFNAMVSEISGVPSPKLRLPDALVMPNAMLLTGLANLIKKPPMWGMSVDQIRTIKEGFRGEGTAVERSLGLRYTPIRTAIEEAIASYRR